MDRDEIELAIFDLFKKKPKWTFKEIVYNIDQNQVRLRH